MARLYIPERNREGISKLFSLDAHTFDKLLTALNSQPPTVNFISEPSSKINIPNVTSSDAEKVLSAIVSLHLARASRDTSSDEFVEQASQAIVTFDPAGQQDTSKQRLLKIVNVRSLIVSAKAFTVLMDRERTMFTAKILTDLRYAFQPDPEQKPYGAVVIHTLKLSYHEEGNHKDFLVALDDKDIAALKVVLDRAETKARILRNQLESIGLADLSDGGQKEDK